MKAIFSIVILKKGSYLWQALRNSSGISSPFLNLVSNKIFKSFLLTFEKCQKQYWEHCSNLFCPLIEPCSKAVKTSLISSQMSSSLAAKLRWTLYEFFSSIFWNEKKIHLNFYRGYAIKIKNNNYFLKLFLKCIISFKYVFINYNVMHICL